ncbi:hypothetical protein IFM89_034491 [Coptis chinensis]|uniref:Lipoyl-binding domain-containing protein n=1 Tax=Coptis chinensis TaxID=261450 RepID=A0A835H7I0_9MAGN|nr:hypothetical protein IFM89_034491 [Coptis chinensis]
MDSVPLLRSFHCSLGTVTHVQAMLEKPGLIPMCNATSNKSPLAGRLSFSPVTRKGTLLPCFKTAETTTVAATPDVAALDSNSNGPVAKKSVNGAIFPKGFEELVLEVCDETDVAELKLKENNVDFFVLSLKLSEIIEQIGDFEMNLKRNIGATSTSIPVISSSEPTAVPSKPVAESAPTSSPPSPPKETISPFKYVSPEKSSKLASLEASGSNGYVLVSSPTGDVIKEGQIIGYLDQFGTELPVKSDVAGEVLKLLFSDGEAIGYGDPLLAVLPSFHGIK